MRKQPAPHDLYGCNHHHPITANQEMVDFGTGPFVADKALVPLLKALNEAGLVTRTHNHSADGHCFVSVILGDSVRVEIKPVYERDSARDTFDGEREILLSWRMPNRE